MITISKICLALVLLGIGGAYAQDFTPKPTVLDSVGIDQRLGEQVPLDLVFKDELGNAVTLGQYFKDRPVILVPAYYECPMLCTQILNGLLSGLRPLSLNAGEDFYVVSFSFNPKEGHELARAKKMAYVEGYQREGSENGWHFLTGDASSISALTKTLGYRYAYDPETGEYIHASGIMLVTPEGKLSRYLYGVEFAPRDLKLGLLESGQEKIGTPVDAVMLFCFQYNPLTGKYSLAVYRLVRIAGLLSVVCIVSFIVVMVRKERFAFGAKAASVSKIPSDL
jgi:protein SCO1/2